MLLIVASLVSLVAANEVLPKESIHIDCGTKLVLWGTRHGNRNPEQFVSTNLTWGHEGNTELTSFGKRQAYGLGVELRKFVGRWLIDENWRPKEAKFYSSSANRCQMTLQTALAGLYKPTAWADWSKAYDDWSPVPYTIDDPMLRMYAVSDCPVSDAAWKPITEDTLPELAKLTADKKALLEYIAKHTGWKPTISNAADLADNLIEMDLYKTSLPTWLSHPTLPGYNKERILKEVMEFAENHQIACAEYAPCRQMMAGYWLHHVLSSIEDAKNGKGMKMIGYASHTEVTLALMKLMGVDKKEVTTSAGFVIEFRDKPTPAVRLLNHDPNPIDQHVIYRAKLTKEMAGLAGKDGFIPLDAFVSAMQPLAIKKWEPACGRQSCPLK